MHKLTGGNCEGETSHRRCQAALGDARGRGGTRAERATSPRLHAPHKRDVDVRSALASLTRPPWQPPTRRRAKQRHEEKLSARHLSVPPLGDPSDERRCVIVLPSVRTSRSDAETRAL
ncbi:hypothetical protein MTO96_002267 [Rhipicephalus appendiculatus]